MAFLNHEGNYSGPMEHIRAYGIPIQLIMIQVAGFAFDLGFLRTTSAPSIASLPTLGMRCGPWIWLVTPPDRAPGKCAMTHRASAGAGAICSCNCLLLTGGRIPKFPRVKLQTLMDFPRVHWDFWLLWFTAIYSLQDFQTNSSLKSCDNLT